MTFLRESDLTQGELASFVAAFMAGRVKSYVRRGGHGQPVSVHEYSRRGRIGSYDLGQASASLKTYQAQAAFVAVIGRAMRTGRIRLARQRGGGKGAASFTDAEYDPQTGIITVYPVAFEGKGEEEGERTLGEVAGTIVHEAQHRAWREYQRATLHDALAQHVARRWESGQALALLKKSDGVSEYSKKYWKGVRVGDALDFEAAVDETLAETARLYFSGRRQRVAPIWQRYLSEVLAVSHRHAPKTVYRPLGRRAAMGKKAVLQAARKVLRVAYIRVRKDGEWERVDSEKDATMIKTVYADGGVVFTRPTAKEAVK